MSVQLFDVVLLIQDRCDLTVAERAKPEQNSRTCYSGFGIHMYKRTKKINDPSLIAGCPAFSLKHPNWDRNMLITNYLLTEQMKSTNDDEIKMGGEGGPSTHPSALLLLCPPSLRYMEKSITPTCRSKETNHQGENKRCWPFSIWHFHARNCSSGKSQSTWESRSSPFIHRLASMTLSPTSSPAMTAPSSSIISAFGS